jgi:hypothetical protein
MVVGVGGGAFLSSSSVLELATWLSWGPCLQWEMFDLDIPGKAMAWIVVGGGPRAHARARACIKCRWQCGLSDWEHQ